MNRSDTVFCIASGPSLTPADCDLVIATGLPVIAVNNTWQKFRDYPGLHALYAGDASWWIHHNDSIPRDQFQLCTASRWVAKELDIEFHRYWKPELQCNSGAGAIMYAASQGAKHIILLGYDCSLKNGTHWHGSHGDLRNPTEASIEHWHNDFQFVRERLSGLDIINATRRTEIKCYPLKNLEKVIAALS